MPMTCPLGMVQLASEGSGLGAKDPGLSPEGHRPRNRSFLGGGAGPVPPRTFGCEGDGPFQRRLLARAPGKLAGRLISQRTMRPLRVVVLAPGRDLALGVRQVREPMRVQTFLAEPSVETFDESILHGFAGLDEVLPHLRFQRPRLHGPRLKLRSVGARGRPPGHKLPTLPRLCG